MSENLYEDAEHEAAHAKVAALKKKNPHANYSVIRGKASGKWHVVRHTSGGMSMVENISFEDFLGESVRVDHDAYKRSHMKSPRGKGNWMVGLGTHNIDFSKHKEGEHYIQHNGELSDAVKKAKEAAKKNGHLSVHVLP